MTDCPPILERNKLHMASDPLWTGSFPNGVEECKVPLEAVVALYLKVRLLA